MRLISVVLLALMLVLVSCASDAMTRLTQQRMALTTANAVWIALVETDAISNEDAKILGDLLDQAHLAIEEIAENPNDTSSFEQNMKIIGQITKRLREIRLKSIEEKTNAQPSSDIGNDLDSHRANGQSVGVLRQTQAHGFNTAAALTGAEALQHYKHAA